MQDIHRFERRDDPVEEGQLGLERPDCRQGSAALSRRDTFGLVGAGAALRWCGMPLVFGFGSASALTVEEQASAQKKESKQPPKTLAVDLRDFVKGDGTDESAGMLAAIATGASVIHGRDMIIRFEDIEINRAIVFDCENVTFKKVTNTKSLCRIRGGNYSIRYKGVRIDGGYVNPTLDYASDIVVTGIGEPGLKLYFENCIFDNIGNWAVAIGFFKQESIHLVSVRQCRSNGRHKPRLSGSISGIFNIANAREFRVDDWRNRGDGEFSDALSLTSFRRMPACSFSVTNTACHFRNINIEDECGLILYSGCHDSNIENFKASRCAFGLRILNSRNCSLREATIEGCILRKVYALEWSPYIRLGTSVGSVVEENIAGFVAENVRIIGGGLGFGSIGAQINGGGKHKVQNARARNIVLRNVRIASGGTSLTLQDTENFSMIGGSLSSDESLSPLINAVQSTSDGLLRQSFIGVEFDRKGGAGRVLAGGLKNGNSQPSTEFQFKDCIYKRIENVSTAVISWRGAGLMSIEAGSVDSDPVGKFLEVAETGRFVFRNVTGLKFPAAKVTFDRASVREVLID